MISMNQFAITRTPTLRDNIQNSKIEVNPKDNKEKKVTGLIKLNRSFSALQSSPRQAAIFNLIADFYQDFKNSNFEKTFFGKDLDEKLDKLYKRPISQASINTVKEVNDGGYIDRFSLENLQKDLYINNAIVRSEISKNSSEFYDSNLELLQKLEEDLGKKVLNSDFDAKPFNDKSNQLESLRYFAAIDARDSGSNRNKFLDALIAKEVSAGKGAYDDVYKGLVKESNEYINKIIKWEQDFADDVISKAKKAIVKDGFALSHNSIR